MHSKQPNSIHQINKRIISCTKCQRLVKYIANVSRTRVKRFNHEKYWGKPLTGFGDTNARVLIIGLAPAAHGGNRTGRMFTGDSSGDWLARALFDSGFANMPTSQRIDDGLQLTDTYITASARCAPPDNKPTRAELDNCFPFLVKELEILQNVTVIICLGRIAFETCRKLLGMKDSKFSHGTKFTCGRYTVICSYHPSRQNTQTGRLSWNQWSSIFSSARDIITK
ncbi:uracil-DNA glycosylase [Nitrosotalea sinensis]|uniref:uracil-DNA glycosylase n=1 Tax=Nitrosotalea sinensis TaxID=1499975 RepID=UPI001FE355EE|nr:uracil-DNA glycosylase [Candidatus Nitrosotalea sinensis]